MKRATKLFSAPRHNVRAIFSTPPPAKSMTTAAATPTIPRSLHSIFSTPQPQNPKPTTTTTTTTPAKTKTTPKPITTTTTEATPAKTKTTPKPTTTATPAKTKTTPKTKRSKPADVQATDSSSGATITKSTKKKGSFEKLVERFKRNSQSSAFRSRTDIYFNTVLRLVRFKRFSFIAEIIDYQKRFPDITDEVFTARLITLYGRSGFFDEARKLFDEMPDLKCPRTVYSYNALLSASVDTGRFDEFKGIFKELSRELGITLDVVSYNVAIKGYCKMGDFGSAESVVDEMVNSGLELNLVTFNTLLLEFYGNGRFDDGEKTWDQMIEMNIVPDIRSYNAKLVGLAFEKRMSEIDQLLEEMRLKGFDPNNLFTFNCLIKGFVAGDSLEEAKLWYGQISANNCKPERFTVDILIPFLCKKGDFDFALEACEDSFKWKLRVEKEVLQLVVDGLVKQSKIQEAEKLVELAKLYKCRLSMVRNQSL